MMDTAQHPWRMNEPWPATIVATHEGTDPPDLEATLAAMAGGLGQEIDILEIHGAPDESHPFSVVLGVPGLHAPVLIACERATAVADAPAELAETLSGCGWVLVGETLLGDDDPLDAYARLAQLLFVNQRTCALLDATTGMWFDRAQVERDLLDETVPPPEEILWRVRVVSASAELDSGSAWLFTTGLLRCGLPELEMLEVPAHRAQEAAAMLDLVAALALESGAPGPEIPLALGEGIHVVLVPWQDAVAILAADSLGSVQDRENIAESSPNPLLSTRAAVCDMELRGAYTQVRTWPEQALDAMSMDGAAIYTSTRSSQRHGLIARSTWPRIVDALDGASGDDLVVFVELPIATSEDGIREHGWIQVQDVRADGGEGRLLRDGAAGMSEGTTIAFDLPDIVAWRMLSGEQTLGSSDGIDPVVFAKGAQ